MTIHPIPRTAVVLFLAVAGSLRPPLAQKRPSPGAQTPRRLPSLGDEVPPALLKHPLPKPCDTGDDRHEPCALLTLGRERITIAWDPASHHITYLASATVVTDDDLRVGDILAIASDIPVVPFPIPASPHRFVSSDWCDTVSSLSGKSEWCALMTPVRPRSGKVVGFVQSLYLNLPNLDAPTIIRTSAAPAAGPR